MERFTNTRDGVGSYTLKDGSKRHRVVYRHNGKVRSKGGFRTKGEAKAWRDRQRITVSRGDDPNPTIRRELFGAFAERWLDEHEDGVRPSTNALYRMLYRRHIAPTFADTAFRHVSQQAVKDWHRWVKRKPAQTKTKRLSDSTVAKVYRLMKQMCEAAVDDGYLSANPCRIKKAGVEKVPDTGYEEPPSAAQVRALADAVEHRYRAMVLLAGFGGLRWGEAAGLDARHINLTDGYVRIVQQLTQVDGGLPTISEPKTDAGRRSVYLHGEVLDALRVHVDRYGTSGLLFSTPSGEPLRASNFRRRVWKPATKKVGCPGVRFHDLRHTAGTLAAQTGATTKDLMARMGHASEKAAMRYQHATQQEQQAIAQKMGERLAQPDNVIAMKRATAR